MVRTSQKLCAAPIALTGPWAVDGVFSLARRRSLETCAHGRVHLRQAPMQLASVYGGQAAYRPVRLVHQAVNDDALRAGAAAQARAGPGGGVKEMVCLAGAGISSERSGGWQWMDP